MITVEKMDATRATVEKLIAQGRQLTEDIAETVSDRARLLKEAEERERVIERLNGEVATLTEQNTELETRNESMAQDIIRLEGQLTDATARLASIRETAADKPAPRNGNGDDDHRKTLTERLRSMPPRPAMRPMPAPTLPAGDVRDG